MFRCCSWESWSKPATRNLCHKDFVNNTRSAMQRAMVRTRETRYPFWCQSSRLPSAREEYRPLARTSACNAIRLALSTHCREQLHRRAFEFRESFTGHAPIHLCTVCDNTTDTLTLIISNGKAVLSRINNQDADSSQPSTVQYKKRALLPHPLILTYTLPIELPTQ